MPPAAVSDQAYAAQVVETIALLSAALGYVSDVLEVRERRLSSHCNGSRRYHVPGLLRRDDVAGSARSRADHQAPTLLGSPGSPSSLGALMRRRRSRNFWPGKPGVLAGTNQLAFWHA